MPSPNTNVVATNAEWQRTYYDRVLLERVLPNIVWPMFGQPKPMPKRSGQSVNWHGYDSLPAATTPLTEGVTPDGRPLSMSNISATPVQTGDYVTVSDVVDMTAPDAVLTEAAELLGEQAGETYDVLTRDTLKVGTSVQRAASRADRVSIQATDKISLTEIRKVVRTFHQNKMKKITAMVNASTGIGTKPIAPAFVAVISASTLYDLKSDAGFVPVQDYASTGNLLPGEVGAMDEVRFVLSNNPVIFTGLGAGGIDVHGTVIFARDAYGIVQMEGIQNIIKGFGSGDDPLNQRATSGWKAFWVAKILNQLAIIRLEHGVTA